MKFIIVLIFNCSLMGGLNFFIIMTGLPIGLLESKLLSFLITLLVFFYIGWNYANEKK